MTTRTEPTPKHTPTPWYFAQYGEDPRALILSKIGERVAILDGGDARTNHDRAETICNSVNTHAALVEALEEALEDWAIMNWDATPQRERIYRKLRSALDAAKEA